MGIDASNVNSIWAMAVLRLPCWVATKDIGKIVSALVVPDLIPRMIESHTLKGEMRDNVIWVDYSLSNTIAKEFVEILDGVFRINQGEADVWLIIFKLNEVV